MLKCNLQFFGGRGGSGGRRIESDFTEDEWQSWSEDPSVYQRLERGEDLTNDFEDWGIEDEYEEYQDMAKRMQSEAESSQLKGLATLYRGERFNSLADAQRKYAEGKTITTTQLTSYSTSKTLAEDYAKMYGNNKVAVVIENTNTNGSSVGLRANHYGYNQNNKDPEVVVPRGLESKVVGTRFDRATNTLYVKLSTNVKAKKKRR